MYFISFPCRHAISFWVLIAVLSVMGLFVLLLLVFACFSMGSSGKNTCGKTSARCVGRFSTCLVNSKPIIVTKNYRKKLHYRVNKKQWYIHKVFFISILDRDCTKEWLVLIPVNFTASHLDSYIQRYSHLNKERWKHIGPIREPSSMHPHNLQKWWKVVQIGFHLSFLKGCIYGCRSPYEMGVKSTLFINNHSFMVSSYC